jgi:hypothetical protein
LPGTNENQRPVEKSQVGWDLKLERNRGSVSLTRWSINALCKLLPARLMSGAFRTGLMIGVSMAMSE